MTAPPVSQPELVELETPIGSEWDPVVRLGLGFEDLDDLQLAVERLLAEAGAQRAVKIAFELSPGRVRTHVGPLREAPIAEALQGPPPAPGELELRRVLETVVDSFGVEEAAAGELVVRLDKRVGPR